MLLLAMEFWIASFLVGYASLQHALCGAEVECEDALHWKGQKEMGRGYCYRYFTGDERSVYIGALAVCRFQHKATLIDKPPTVEEQQLLGIKEPIWIANEEETNFSLDWDVRAETCYQMIGRSNMTAIDGKCNSESHKAKVMCEAEREFKNRNAHNFPLNDYEYRNMQMSAERFTFVEAAAFCIKQGRLVNEKGRMQFPREIKYHSFRYWDCEPPCWLWKYKKGGDVYYIDEAIGPKSLQGGMRRVFEQDVLNFSLDYDIGNVLSFICRRASKETKTSQQPESAADSDRHPTTSKVVSSSKQRWSWLLVLIPVSLVFLPFIITLALALIRTLKDLFHSPIYRRSSTL